MELLLSDMFKERTLIDVDDLWDKQKKYGTAVDANGDFIDGPIVIAKKYGLKFETASGKKGTYYPDGTII